MTAQKFCGVCGNEFWTRGNKGKYCSPECRRLVSSIRVEQKLNVPKEMKWASLDQEKKTLRLTDKDLLA